MRCPLSDGAKTVCLMGSGNPSKVKIMVVGEAPGATEDEEGKPFIGRAGQLLDDIIKITGLKREEMYITNAVKCRPPDNKTPTKKQTLECSFFLQGEIDLIKPDFVVLLGNTALQSVLGMTGIRKLRGKPIEKDGVVFLPTYHPSYALRDPKQRVYIETDFKLLRDMIKFGGVPKEKNINNRIVYDKRDLLECRKDLRRCLKLNRPVSFDIETNALYPFHEDSEIITIGFGTKETQWSIPIGHKDYDGPLEFDEVIEFLDPTVKLLKLIMHNGKFDSLWVYVHFDVLWTIWSDTMLAHYILDENSSHGLKFLAQLMLNAPDWDISAQGKMGNEISIEEHCEYHAHDLYYTRKLWFKLNRDLKEFVSIQKVFWKILMPIANMFVEAEHRGIYINTSKMDTVEEKLRTNIDKSLDRLSEFGPDVNWRSPKQVGELLFGELGIKPLDKTKSGAPSTSESVLKRIDHPVTEAMLAYRHDDQQMKMFIDGWKPYLVHGRLHPSFKIHGTVTGRLSCENPNLQQVPRDPTIRSLIDAPKGWTLVEADLSQVELRIAADMANEHLLLQIFNEGGDPHWTTCLSELARGGGETQLVIKTAKALSKTKGKLTYSKAMDILMKSGSSAAQAVDKSWKELRKKAKAVNFGYLYGMWWRKFVLYARDNYGVKVTDQQAQESRENFFQQFPGFPAWHKKQRRFAELNGYVVSYSGRRRRLPRAMDMEDSYEKQEALRQAINSPVQSFANELNLMAAIQLHGEFGRDIFHIVGTVHDSILMEIRDEALDYVVPRVLEVMAEPDILKEFGINMKVPIEAEAEVGAWGIGKEWK